MISEKISQCFGAKWTPEFAKNFEAAAAKAKQRISVTQYGTDARVGTRDGQTYISHKTASGKWSRWTPARLSPA